MGGDDNNELQGPKTRGRTFLWLKGVTERKDLVAAHVWGGAKKCKHVLSICLSLFLIIDHLYVNVSCVMLQARRLAEYTDGHVEYSK